MTRKLLRGLLALALLGGAALAADNVILDQQVGPNWQLRTTDQGNNVHVPHVITEGTAPSSSTAVGLAPIVSAAAEGSKVLKASPGNLYALEVKAGATAGLLMIFDATSAPADGAVTPDYCVEVAANTARGMSWGTIPAIFATGIVAVFSTGTNCFNKAISATAFFSAQVS